MLRFSLRTLALRRAKTLSPDALTRLQTERLRAVLRAALQSPFYRDKYQGIDLARCSLSDLPPTHKSEMMAAFDEVSTDRAVTRAGLEAFMDDPANSDRLFLGKYVASHTSGSQGQPMLILQDRECVELFFGLQMTRGNAEPATFPQAVRRLIQPKRLAVVTLKQGFYPSATLFQHMPRAASRYVNLLWLSQTDPNVIERLNAFRPEALSAYAGVLEMLAIEAEAGRLRLAPELLQVVNNSEALVDRAAARIGKAFGLHVMNNYATGECPFLSTGCPTDTGAHLNSDWAILEVVDEHGRPVPPGSPGAKVYITNLANRVLPFIRYEVGDVVTMATETCRCGSHLPRIERIGGRAADVFWVGNGSRRRRLINLVFTHAFEYLTDLREWQAIQRGPCRVLVRLEPLPGRTLDLARARWALDRELAAYDYEDVAVEFEVVTHLPPDPRTGKFRRMIPLAIPGPHTGVPISPAPVAAAG